ncbi:DUF3017 domain-containing protein [Bifidobacterium olomucense]|uniref:Rod shape-determining protein RodA n=1 Tax=Bifidobacterium olomucense TaxID=2675324 RepID=A0A7Y0EXM3_9BIFI|nr:rod shape-determining protein RodA [Bifidobacterium sp. DSM 109959]
MHNHPYVSEAHEGKPWFEWIVLGVIIAATLLAVCGYTMAATVVIAVTAIMTGLIRLILRDHSPWKVRSVAFDSFIGIALGVGLLITYFSFFGLLNSFLI